MMFSDQTVLKLPTSSSPSSSSTMQQQAAGYVAVRGINVILQILKALSSAQNEPLTGVSDRHPYEGCSPLNESCCCSGGMYIIMITHVVCPVAIGVSEIVSCSRLVII